MLNKIFSLLIIVAFFVLLYYLYIKEQDNKEEKLLNIEKKEEVLKTPIFEKVEQNKKDNTNDEKDNLNVLEKKQKIEKLKIKSSLKRSFAFFELDDELYMFFEDKKNWILSMNLFKDDKKIFLTDVKKVPSNSIKVDKVYQNSDLLYVSIWEQKYFLDTKKMSLEKIFFPQNIKYIKDSWENFIIVNEKWSFLMDKKTKEITYFYLFSDFVYLNDWSYIWVINSDEKEKKENYSLSSNKNLIIKYNPKTKEMNIFKEVDFKIQKIILKNNFEISFFDINNNEYILTNF